MNLMEAPRRRLWKPYATGARVPEMQHEGFAWEAPASNLRTCWARSYYGEPRIKSPANHLCLFSAPFCVFLCVCFSFSFLFLVLFLCFIFFPSHFLFSVSLFLSVLSFFLDLFFSLIFSFLFFPLFSFFSSFPSHFIFPFLSFFFFPYYLSFFLISFSSLLIFSFSFPLFPFPPFSSPFFLFLETPLACSDIFINVCKQFVFIFVLRERACFIRIRSGFVPAWRHRPASWAWVNYHSRLWPIWPMAERSDLEEGMHGFAIVVYVIAV